MILTKYKKYEINSFVMRVGDIGKKFYVILYRNISVLEP